MVPAEEFNIQRLKDEKNIFIKVNREFDMEKWYFEFFDTIKKERSTGWTNDVMLVVEETGSWVHHHSANSAFFKELMLRSRRYHSCACVFHHIRQVPPVEAASATKWVVFSLAWNKKDVEYVREHMPELEEYIEEIQKPENKHHFVVFDVPSRQCHMMTPVGAEPVTPKEPEHKEEETVEDIDNSEEDIDKE